MWRKLQVCLVIGIGITVNLIFIHINYELEHSLKVSGKLLAYVVCANSLIVVFTRVFNS